MRFFKVVNNDYITSIGTSNGGEEITESEYNEILTAIHNKPQATETTDYLLKADLTWEAYEVEPVEPDPSDDDYATAGKILMGVEE